MAAGIDPMSGPKPNGKARQINFRSFITVYSRFVCLKSNYFQPLKAHFPSCYYLLDASCVVLFSQVSGLSSETGGPAKAGVPGARNTGFIRQQLGKVHGRRLPD